MFNRFTVSRTALKSALALHVSLLTLTACNGTQPMPLFPGAGSAAANKADAAQTLAPGQSMAACDPCTAEAAGSNGGGEHTGGVSQADNQNGNNNGGSGPKISQQMPVYHVVGHGIDAGQAKQLAAAFKLRELKLDTDGSVSYLDADRFQKIPTRDQAGGGFSTKQLTHVPASQYPSPNSNDYENPDQPSDKPTEQPSAEASDYLNEDREAVRPEFLDLPALRAIKVLPESVALDQILIGLNKAGLMPEGKPVLGHSEFEMRGVDGGESLKIQLDTQVGFEQTLGQLKLIGPGAKVKVVLDGEGVVTQLRYAGRKLRAGESVGVMAPSDAEQQALLLLNQAHGAQGKGQWEVSSELVYYAPPLDQRVKTIFPHYLVTAKMRSEGEEISSRLLMLPAVQNGLKIKLDLRQDGSRMLGNARVEGGTAPYRYSWSSAKGQLDTSFGDKPSIAYGLSGRGDSRSGGLNQAETLYLTVTDANGLSTSVQASHTLEASQIKSFDASAFKTMAPGRFDAGTEWVGLSQGLGGSRDNAYGFVNGFRGRGTPVEFNFGDYAAWEEDFKKVSSGGNDDNYVDNVDMAFYTGHANGNLFTFPGTRDDGQLHYNDGSYGERELEWLMIAACGPMQVSEGGVHLFDRWGRVFKGLHMLAGYATVSFDNTIEGDRLARYLLAENRTVRHAWAQMAADAQPASVIYGYMGVYGPGGSSNWNDHYWGHGAVGPDIRTIHGYWSVHAPS